DQPTAYQPDVAFRFVSSVLSEMKDRTDLSSCALSRSLRELTWYRKASIRPGLQSLWELSMITGTLLEDLLGDPESSARAVQPMLLPSLDDLPRRKRRTSSMVSSEKV